MKLWLIKYWQLLVLLILLIPFIIFQITILNRPFYWDEAWSYASAVEAMFQKGPSLLPGAIDAYLYRGHPTFFYFITTVWMKIFGPTLVSIHSFFLIVSILLVFAVYKLGQFIGGKTVALLASVSLLLTPLFIAQAGFLLPEVMLALFSVLAVYFYLRKKIILEIICCSLILLTKETGLVIFGTIVLYDFIQRIRKSENVSIFFKELKPFAWHLLPIVPVTVFFLCKK